MNPAPGDPAYDERQRRLEAIEHQLENLLREIGKIRESLGVRNTALMFELDQRYMPRGEMSSVYIPRRELEEREDRLKEDREKQKSRHLEIPVIVFAALTWLTNLYLLLTSGAPTH